MSTPEVTVSLAVYNTMPYLRATLDSLVGQSIGRDRMEVVAVDDGSTDGSGELLDEYAARHPELFRVIHQDNSGGPAGPCNRALEVASGRFVYFLGADDYLGAQALERMVGYADEHDADIVMGRVVGVNGRSIRQRIFRENTPDLDRYGPDLRWSLANTNLYRRSLVERLGLRYVEGLPFGSDQPFMLEAAVHAGRIAVLGDYTCYYAVDRHEKSNISYSTGYPERLRCITVLVETAARLVPAGAARDTVLVRHFTWEVPSLLRQGFGELPESARPQVCADVASLVDRFGDQAILDELRVVPRVLLRLARHGQVDLLAAMLEESGEGARMTQRLVVGPGGVYVDYPGFSAADPDPTYLLPDPQGLRDRLAATTSTRAVTWRRRGPSPRLQVEVATALADPAGLATVGAELRGPGGSRAVEDLTVLATPGGSSLLLRVDVPLGTARWRLHLTVHAAGHTVDVPVPTHPLPGRVRWWRAGAVQAAWVDDTDSVLAVRTERVPLSQAARAVVRRLTGRR